MSEDTSNDNQTVQPDAGSSDLPPQESPQDTSNWDDRPFTTPSDRIVIETFQGDDGKTKIAE